MKEIVLRVMARHYTKVYCDISINISQAWHSVPGDWF